MTQVRSALFLDFDNVFSGLLALDPESAMRFAETPADWLTRLGMHADGRQTRRWLVLRCYLNPEGSVADPEHQGVRLHFSKFRRSFTDAGFEVVDCPRVARAKNAADIRLVIDALDAVRVEPHYDEFVIVSADSDMTPLIVRLRALDRRVTLVSSFETADIMRSVAHEVITGDDLLSLIGGPVRVAEIDFGKFVSARFAESATPINIGKLAQEVHDAFGSVIKESHWFGHNQFITAVKSLGLSNLEVSQHYLWDTARHSAPIPISACQTVAVHESDVSVRLQHAIKLPLLPVDAWCAIYDRLADFGKTHEFSMSGGTRWCQDQLASAGTEVSRQVISIVMRGTAAAGCPLYRQPLPESHEIAAAFVQSVLDRADAAGLELSDAEEEQVRARLGVRDLAAGERAG